jgi:hypothetical protein
MTDRPPQHLNVDSGRERRSWLLAWRFAALAFLLLLAACAYWIITLGFFQAIAEVRFQWAVFGAVLTGILLLGRFTVRALTRGIAFERRNATLMDLFRPGWFMRRTRRDRED